MPEHNGENEWPTLVFYFLESCPGAQVDFEGHQGIFIQGSITPAFPGVVVSIKVEQSDTQDAREFEVLTDDNGAYRYVLTLNLNVWR